MSGGDERRERSLEIVRVFDAPRSLVFRAWLEPAHLRKWFAPGHHGDHPRGD